MKYLLYFEIYYWSDLREFLVDGTKPTPQNLVSNLY